MRWKLILLIFFVILFALELGYNAFDRHTYWKIFVEGGEV
jgi:hypothetical protein